MVEAEGNTYLTDNTRVSGNGQFNQDFPQRRKDAKKRKHTLNALILLAPLRLCGSTYFSTALPRVSGNGQFN